VARLADLARLALEPAKAHFEIAVEREVDSGAKGVIEDWVE